MFERSTARAQRVLFFARYEASQLGSMDIDTEHLLLGLVFAEVGIWPKSNVHRASLRTNTLDIKVLR